MSEYITCLFFGDTFIEDKVAISLDSELRLMVEESDIVCCNLEAPIRALNQTPAKEYGVKLSQSKEAINTLDCLGFNLYALSNNHMMNFGVEGLKNTLSSIPSKNRIGAGENYQQVYTPKIISKGDVTVGIFNVAERQYGVAEENFGVGHAWIFSDRFFEELKEAKKTCDQVIVVCHAGLENTDIPLPEWRNTYKHLIDCGVNVIIGHHPHVVQGWEEYNGGMIFYSLGNFIWESKSCTSCNKPTIGVRLSLLKESFDYEIVPIKCDGGQVIRYSDNRFSKYLNELCTILHNEECYIKKIDEVCETEYKRSYRNKCFELLGLRPQKRVRHWLLNIFSVMSRKNKPDEKLMYLWCGNETTRWVVTRALIISRFGERE